MRLFFPTLTIMFVLCSCRDIKDKKPVAVPVSGREVIKADTFNLHYLDTDPKLQDDILLDTISIPESKKHWGISLIYPVLSKGEYPYVNKWLSKIIKDRRDDFYETVKEEEASADTSRLLYYGWVRPLLLYRTNKLMSLVLEEGAGYNASSPWRGYPSFNFDLEKKKEIWLDDYFILKTKADSSFLENIFKQCVNEDFNLETYKEYPQDHFAFDSSSVYFLFDKYHPLGWGIYSVEKKYIIDHINPLYR